MSTSLLCTSYASPRLSGKAATSGTQALDLRVWGVQAFVLSILLDGREMWPVRAADKSPLAVFDNDCVR